MNAFGRKYRVSIFGESHGELIGVVLDGVPAGLEISEQDFETDILRRKSGAKGTTPRIEADKPEIVSGVYEGHTTGAPLTIIFRNGNGIEDYWDYTASTAGRAGTGYVNNYSGNLTWIHSDIGFGGNRMPVTISHVYNANDSTLNTFGLGYGWRTNFNQTISIETWHEGTPQEISYYVWTDGDGTRHYFPIE